MRFYEFEQKKPKNNKDILIQFKEYGWGIGNTLNTGCAKFVEDKCIMFPTILEIEMSLDRIVRWSYI